MRLIVGDVAARRTLDRARVYSTGHSNGGYMSYRLACSASDLVAAVAPVSAGSPFLNFDAGCFPSRPVPVLTLHGNNDNTVPYEDGEAVFTYAPKVAARRLMNNGRWVKGSGGGRSPDRLSFYHFPKAHAFAPWSCCCCSSGFRGLNNCQGNPVVTLSAGNTTCEAWTQCAQQGNGVVRPPSLRPWPCPLILRALTLRPPAMPFCSFLDHQHDLLHHRGRQPLLLARLADPGLQPGHPELIRGPRPLMLSPPESFVLTSVHPGCMKQIWRFFSGFSL